MADTIKQKILFQMGTSGTSKTTKSFASMAVKITAVSAAVGLAVKGLSKLYDAAVQLDRQIQAVTIDMTQYNAETKGLIDTNDGLSAAIQLQEANIKASAEEMAALGKAAIQMNQRLGDDAEGATTIFNGLVKSIVNARETGLVKFGIELSQTADKTAASNEALEKMVEKFGDVEVKAGTVKEQLYALNNTIGTIAAFEFNQVLEDIKLGFAGLISGIDDATVALGRWESDLILSKGAMAENFSALTDLDAIQLAYNETVIESIERGEDLYILEGRLIQQNEGVSRSTLEKAKAYYEQKKSIEEVIRSENALAEIEARKKAEAVQGKNVDKIRKLVEMMRNSGVEQDVQAAFNKASRIVEENPDTNYSQLDLMNQLERQLSRVRKEQKFIQSLGGGRGGGGGGRASSKPTSFIVEEKKIRELQQFDIKEKLTLDQGSVDTARAGLAGAGASAGQAAAQAQAEAQILAKQNMYQNLLGLERQYLAESNRMNAMSNQQKADSAEAMGSAVGQTFNNLAKSMNTESKEGFNAMKAMSYAGNIVETTLAATAAFRSVMQSVPFPANVIAAPILAGSVAAMGAANGAKIRKQKYGTSGSVSASTPKASFPSGGMGAGSGQQASNYVFNVNVDGNTIHKSMINANDMANQSGEKHFMTGTN